ncbi:replication endonuclease [Rugamonas sp. A1-17]|nr:replication endonuclease [Rugamonas sp. A1-17]
MSKPINFNTYSNDNDKKVKSFNDKYYKLTKKRLIKKKIKLNSLDDYVLKYEQHIRVSKNADKQIEKLHLKKGLDYFELGCLAAHIHTTTLEKTNEILNYSTNEIIEIRQKFENRTEINHEYVKKNFENWRNFLVEHQKIEIKKSFIPFEIFNEVSFIVKNKYQNDWSLYFKDVEQYFNTISLKEFKLFEDRKTTETVKETTQIMNKSNKKLSSKKRKILHHMASLLKLAGHDRATYISNSQLNLYKQSIVKQQRFMQSMQLINKDGYLMDLSKATKSKEQYIAEKINMIRTMELFAIDRGYTWSFVTITSEGEHHPFPKFKQDDFQYSGVSAADSAKLLAKDWNNIRALMKMRGLEPAKSYFGATTSEAHTDSLRHIHCIIFHHINDLDKIKDAFFTAKPKLKERVLICEEKQKNLDALLNTGKITRERYKELSKKVRNPWRICDKNKIEDKSKLGAVNYCFKYIMKSCAVFDADFDVWKEHDDETNAVLKNNAFRNALGIRGFSFFGFENCLSKFRFLARKIACLKTGQTMDGVSPRLEQIIRANDLYSFIKERFIDVISNKYNTNSQGKKVFVGIIINNIQYLKNFFFMTKKSILTELVGWKESKDDEHIYLNEYVKRVNYKELALKAENDALNSGILVIHNYSSEKRKAEKQKNHPVKKWKNNNFKDIYKRFYKFVDISKDFIQKNLVLCNNY